MENDTLLLFGGGRPNSIGWAILELFLKNGWKVVLFDKVSILTEVSPRDRLYRCVCDLTVDSDIEHAFEFVHGCSINPSGMIYAAGYNRINAISDYDLPTWEMTLRLNLTAPFLCLRELVRKYPTPVRGYPFVYAILGSNTSYVAKTKSAAYGASKAGVVQMAACAHRELAPSGYSVTVLNFGPVLDTDMDINTQDELQRQRGWEREEYKKQIVKNIPIKRFTRQEEIASLAWFALSTSCGQLFGGRAINFDGGQQQG